jgi:hypothetical protein
LFAAISLLSKNASMPKNTNKPAVKLKKKLYWFLVIFLINGYHASPISTGITPTNTPNMAKIENWFTFGMGAGAAASMTLLNLVPSEVVIPTS